MKKNKIVNELGKANLQVLFGVYSQYRERFVNFAIKRYPVNRSEVISIYKDIVINLYEYILNDKFSKLNSSPKKFIFQRGDRRIRQYLRTRNFEIEHSEKQEKSTGETSASVKPFQMKKEILIETEREKIRRQFDEFYVPHKSKYVIAYWILAIVLTITTFTIIYISGQRSEERAVLSEELMSKSVQVKVPKEKNKEWFKFLFKKHKNENIKKVRLQSLYDKYFVVYPYVLNVDQDSIQKDSLVRAMRFYSQGRFDEALLILNILLKEKEKQERFIDLQFYTSMCYMNSGRLKKVFRILSSLALTQNKYHDQALWYLSLANLKKNRVRESKAILSTIIESKSYNYQKATALFRDLSGQ